MATTRILLGGDRNLINGFLSNLKRRFLKHIKSNKFTFITSGGYYWVDFIKTGNRVKGCILLTENVNRTIIEEINSIRLDHGNIPIILYAENIKLMEFNNFDLDNIYLLSMDNKTLELVLTLLKIVKDNQDLTITGYVSGYQSKHQIWC